MPNGSHTERFERILTVTAMTDGRVVPAVLRRVTFGPTAAEVDAAVAAGGTASPLGVLDAGTILGGWDDRLDAVLG